MKNIFGATTLLALAYIPHCYAEQLHLSNEQAQLALTALYDLNAGQSQVVKVGGADTAVQKHYSGWKLSTILAMKRDIDVLKGPVMVYEQAIQQRRTDLASDDGTLSKTNGKKLQDEVNRMKDEVLTVDAVRITPSELLIEQNNIPPNDLSLLGPLLQDEADANKNK